jgi:gas vesicle protein
LYSERDWGETSATAYDLSHGGRRMSAAQRARRRAENWTGKARDSMSSARESWREGAEEMGERAESMGERMSTAYDETMGRARDTAQEWTDQARDTAQEWTDQARDTAQDLSDQARSTARQAKDTIRDSMDDIRERAADARDSATRGVRRVARRAAEYGRTARDAVAPEGALVNFCREQPMLVAGLGVAIGAALAAMIPASRTERRVMGEASRNVQERVRDVAEQAMQPLTDRETEAQQGRHSAERSANGPDTGGAATEFDRSVRQGSQSPNVENEPQSAPYAEAAEAGVAGQGIPASGETTTKSL